MQASSLLSPQKSQGSDLKPEANLETQQTQKKCTLNLGKSQEEELSATEVKKPIQSMTQVV